MIQGVDILTGIGIYNGSLFSLIPRIPARGDLRSCGPGYRIAVAECFHGVLLTSGILNANISIKRNIHE